MTAPPEITVTGVRYWAEKPEQLARLLATSNAPAIRDPSGQPIQPNEIVVLALPKLWSENPRELGDALAFAAGKTGTAASGTAGGVGAVAPVEKRFSEVRSRPCGSVAAFWSPRLLSNAFLMRTGRRTSIGTVDHSPFSPRDPGILLTDGHGWSECRIDSMSRQTPLLGFSLGTDPASMCRRSSCRARSAAASNLSKSAATALSLNTFPHPRRSCERSCARCL
jgi:hypothetical protein